MPRLLRAAWLSVTSCAGVANDRFAYRFLRRYCLGLYVVLTGWNFCCCSLLLRRNCVAVFRFFISRVSAQAAPISIATAAVDAIHGLLVIHSIGFIFELQIWPLWALFTGLPPVYCR